jgi:hypothetical protein
MGIICWGLFIAKESRCRIRRSDQRHTNESEVCVELRSYTAPLLPIQRLHSSTDRFSVPIGVVIGDAPE